MKKLIEKTQDSVVVCDNKNCNFEVPYTDQEAKNLHKYINMPCPKCGENLCTLQDYIQHQKVLRIINWVNKWFSWITIFYSKKKLDSGQEITIYVHEGVKISNVKDDK